MVSRHTVSSEATIRPIAFHAALRNRLIISHRWSPLSRVFSYLIDLYHNGPEAKMRKLRRAHGIQSSGSINQPRDRWETWIVDYFYFLARRRRCLRELCMWIGKKVIDNFVIRNGSIWIPIFKFFITFKLCFKFFLISKFVQLKENIQDEGSFIYILFEEDLRVVGWILGIVGMIGRFRQRLIDQTILRLLSLSIKSSRIEA